MALRVWGASAAAIAVTLSAPVGAQEVGQAAAPSGYIALDPIAIFATLTPIAAFDYPGQVSVVAREEIQTRQASSIGEVFKDVPGVFVDGGARRAGQAPTIRGFREEDILILVDGVKQSFISGHDGRVFIEPDLLKSVEVVKGPVSALYGSGALGGVIALTTVDAADFLDPGETAGVRVKAGYQSVNDEFAITTTGFTRSLDGRYDVVASFTYRDAGDIELGNGVTLPEEEQIKSSLVKGTAQLTPDLKLTTSWVHYETDVLNPNNPQGNNIGDIVDRVVESDTVSAKLSYNPLNPLIDGNLLVYWARHSNEETDTVAGRTGAFRNTLREIETTGVNIDNRSRFTISDTTNLTLTYGAEYYVDRQTGEDTNASLTSPSNVPDADASYYGAFVQAEFDITPPAGLPGELKIIPGVRWDGFENDYKDVLDYEDFKDQAVSPKIGASYKPVPWLLLFGNYGSAFRAPSYTELYAQGIHFPGGFGRFGPLGFNRFIDNPELRPQDAETIEVGAGLDFGNVIEHGDKFTVKGSYWQTDAKNFIDLNVVTSGCAFAPGSTFNQATCISQFENTPNAELDGVEIEANYDAARWYAGLAYTHIDGRDTDTGLFLGTLQPDKIVLNAGVKVPEWWSRFGARFTFADEFTKFNPGSETGPRAAYNLIDLYAVIEPTDGPFKGFRLDLGIDNVTDEAYELIAKDAFEEGRNYKAAITYTHKW
jgi:hemoglobin/transferrin/lactoferrin receptor protein